MSDDDVVSLKDLCKDMKGRGFTHACLTDIDYPKEADNYSIGWGPKPGSITTFFSRLDSGFHDGPKVGVIPAWARWVHQNKYKEPYYEKCGILFMKQSELKGKFADQETVEVLCTEKPFVFNWVRLKSNGYLGVYVNYPTDAWQTWDVPTIAIWDPMCLGETYFYANAGPWEYVSNPVVHGPRKINKSFRMNFADVFKEMKWLGFTHGCVTDDPSLGEVKSSTHSEPGCQQDAPPRQLYFYSLHDERMHDGTKETDFEHCVNKCLSTSSKFYHFKGIMFIKQSELEGKCATENLIRSLSLMKPDEKFDWHRVIDLYHFDYANIPDNLTEYGVYGAPTKLPMLVIWQGKCLGESRFYKRDYPNWYTYGFSPVICRHGVEVETPTDT